METIKTGIGREALYKALRADAQPRFDTVARVCKALGVRLVVQPSHAQQGTADENTGGDVRFSSLT